MGRSLLFTGIGFVLYGFLTELVAGDTNRHRIVRPWLWLKDDWYPENQGIRLLLLVGLVILPVGAIWTLLS